MMLLAEWEEKGLVVLVLKFGSFFFIFSRDLEGNLGKSVGSDSLLGFCPDSSYPEERKGGGEKGLCLDMFLFVGKGRENLFPKDCHLSLL